MSMMDIYGNKEQNNKEQKKDFREAVSEGRWTQEVIPMFEQSNSYHKTQIKGKGTALHVAVNNGNADVVRRLVEAVVQHEGAASGGEEGTSALATTNEQGASPLHLAARRGFVEICKCIIGAGGEGLMYVRNKKGETPLFSAVKTRQLKTFAFLYQLVPNDPNLAIRNKEDTILHIAIRREFLDMAVIIVHCYPVLLDLRNGDQATPLEILAARPSAFKSGTYLTWGKRILYHCIYVKPLDAKTAMERYLTSEGVGKNRNKASSSIIEKDKSQVAIQLGPVDTSQAISEKEDCARYADINDLCFQFADIIQKLVFIFCRPWLSLLGISKADLVAIYRLKQKHRWASQLLNKFMVNPYQSYMGIDVNNPEHEHYTEDHDEEKDDEVRKLRDFINQIHEQRDSLNKGPGSSKQKAQQSGKKENSSEAPQENEKKEKYVDSENKESGSSKQEAPQQNEKKEKYDPKETAFLAAAKNGIVEIVLALRDNLESVVHDTNSKKQNVLLVAVKNRQPYVVVELMRNLKSNGHIKQFESLTFETDDEENNVLHMAAGSVSDEEKTWQIAGAAMQMMWDIKWYQYIKWLAPEHLACRANIHDKTPGVVFQEQHRGLVSEGSEWLKDTANSCSVVAALIAGVSFATASTVPGGNNQDSSHPDLNGQPALEGKPAFDTFAIASLVGLCFSVTALVMFLAILTSRKQVEDFRRSIPVKLLVGFSSLFVSIAAMLVAFCAGNFFLLKDKYKESIIFPIYVATCLPVTLYAIVQFPLYADLVKTILKKVPQPSGRGVNF